MQVWIEFEEIVTRRVVANCTDTFVAREIWENENRSHIREGWADESVEVDRRVDWDSGSLYPEDPERVLRPGQSVIHSPEKEQ